MKLVRGPEDPGRWNKYAYVENNPINLVDPIGLSATCEYPCIASVTVHAYSTAGIFGAAEGSDGDHRRNQPRPFTTAQLRMYATDLRAAVTKGGSDCDALAAFAGAASDNDSSKLQFVRDFSILTPANKLPGSPGFDGTSNYIRLNQGSGSGYLPIFQNTYNDNGPSGTNGDQGHHFAAFFQLGYYRGELAGAGVSFWFEYFETRF